MDNNCICNDLVQNTSTYKKGIYCGITSTDSNSKNLYFLKEFCKNVFKNNGCLIFEYTQPESLVILEKFLKTIGYQLDILIKRKHIIPISVEDNFINNDNIVVKDIINIYRNIIKDLKSKGKEKIVLFCVRQGIYRKYLYNSEIYELHKSLLDLTIDEGIMVFIKYNIYGFIKEIFLDLFYLHNVFILGDDYKIYTYGEEDFQKIEILLKYIVKIHNTNEEMIKEREKNLKVEKLKMLGELAGGITHDFNNILTSILGFSQLGLKKTTDIKAKRYLDLIYKSSLDGKDMVKKIQTLTIKKGERIKKKANLNELVKTAIDICKPRWKNDFERRHIEFKVITDLKSKNAIICVEHEIREVILNIVLNAIDAMEQGGKLFINTYDNGCKTYLEIKDTGIGMRKELIDKIFEPFYSTKECKGSGLGLSIVKKIIDDHNGDIVVKSTPGYGTEFIISFDSFSDDIVCESEPIQKYGEKDFQISRVLVLDDKKYVAKSISELLGALGVETDIEIDSSNINSIIKEKDYDAIFCDLAMPNFNGIEVSKIVKKHSPNTKVVLMTGWTGEIEDSEIKEIDYILGKPCTLEDISYALEKVIMEGSPASL